MYELINGRLQKIMKKYGVIMKIQITEHQVSPQGQIAPPEGNMVREVQFLEFKSRDAIKKAFEEIADFCDKNAPDDAARVEVIQQ